MTLKDIKGQIGTKFMTATGMRYMTLFLCAGMIKHGNGIGGEETTAVVSIYRPDDNMAHPGHTSYMQDSTEIKVIE